PGKWEYLKSIGIKHIMNSRNTDFAMEIHPMTQGQGIDIVLNSLSGEFIYKSLDVLKKGGRCIEIGKIGILSQSQVHKQRPDVAYFPFDLHKIAQDHSELIFSMIHELVENIDKGYWKPLPYTVFPIHQVKDAFRYMAQAKHIGKIVISHSETSLQTVKSDGVYVITGGLGSLGLQVSRWLSQKGAKHLVLIEKNDPSDSARKILDEFQKDGIRVRIEKADVTHLQDMKKLIDTIKNSNLHLKGICHLAGILDDGVLIQQTQEQFERVMNPKIQGAWNLHTLTQDIPIDWFVCFSSLASVMGSQGQANYSAANAFLDGLAHYRRSLGLHGLSINWGPWADSGMVSRTDRRHQQRWSVNTIESETGLDILDQLLKENATQVMVAGIDWSRFFKTWQKPSPFFSNFTQKTALENPSSFIRQLHEAPFEKKYEMIEDHVYLQISNVLALPKHTRLEPRQRLFDAGIDSLMAVELKNRLELSLERQLRSTLIFDYPTIEALINYIADMLQIKPISAQQLPEQPQQSLSVSDTHDDLDDISQDDLALLLAKELAAIREGKKAG
ncbi:MAG: SDR family NAD(P)-dependent oxidoreductase, partial [Desulfobacterales bacterium]|nr:SDR family NAD(P)-dependent oxidoreductase [Desulfobacterales bacterium]